jgi:hypothetical protein
MKTSGPPALANRLLSTLVPGERSESMIGDLVEQHQRGRSTGWYWRQTLRAIAASFIDEALQHVWLAASVAALSFYFDKIYTLSKMWMLVWRVDRLWYPHLINSSLSWLVIDPWAYRLQPYWWTANLAVCGLLAALTWIVVRLYPRQRGLVLAVVLIVQLGTRVPYVWSSVADFWRQPTNPIAFYGLLWFSFYTFVAIPLSIFLAGRRGLSSEF